MPKYYMPTVLLSGNNCIKRHPRHLLHGKKCMIITGAKSAVLSGALDDVKAVLNDNNIEYELYSGVNGNTNISEIYNIAQTAKEHNIDYLIGIGGGSVLDAAKTVSVYATNDIEPMQIFDEKYENTPLKVVCVPTTAGTGSDTTQYVMLTIDEPHNKHSFSSEMCFPYATYLDTRYTMTMPVDVTRNTAVDALCHAIESYLNVQASAFSDTVSLEAIRLIGKSAVSLLSGKFSEEDRENLLVAASSGGMAVAHTGLNLVHLMGHKVTCSKDIPHGRANGALLVEFIAFVAQTNIMRAVKVIDAFGYELSGFKKLMDKLAPIDVKITEEDIDEWVELAITDHELCNCPCTVTKDDLRTIYYNAFINKERNYKQW